MTLRQSDRERVQDYLNDKLNTLSDLDSLDLLLASVQTQQQQLREQLDSAETAVERAQTAARENRENLLHQTLLFQQTQADIDRLLLATTSADTASEAAAQFTASIEKLRRLDVAQGYVELLLQVQDLSAEARKHIVKDPREALKPYTKLQKLSHGLQARNKAAAEEAAVHLVNYVEKSTGALWEEMKSKLSIEFKETLDKIKWPTPDPRIKDSDEAVFRSGFEKLLILQEPEIEEGAKDKPLLPFEALVKPMAVEFWYHFESTKPKQPTNRIDKPEWFLSHLTSLVTSYTPFLTSTVQPILSSFENPVISSRNAITEFITALLPVLRRKIRRLLPQLLDEPQYLSHFIHEMIKFDAELRAEFFYSPYGTDGIWKGITHEVLVVEGGFTEWLKVEKDFALARYHAIVAAEDAWVIDYVSVQSDDTKPTKSAMRLKDLLENVTDTYRPLVSFSQRLRFLIDIQISILDQYHERLTSSVEALRVLSSSIARAVQGTSKDEAQSLSGLGGLERLCRVYGSAMYMEMCMRDWGEDIFFLELWEELQAAAQKSQKSNPNKALAGNRSAQDVANITSSAVLSGDDDGALFDETAGSYRRLRLRTEDMITELIVNGLKEDLKPYTRVGIWASVDHRLSAGSDTTVSPEIVQPAASLNAYLGFLRKALAPAVFRRIYRNVAGGVQSYLWDYVVMAHQFSYAGARQFARDVAELWNVAGRFVDEPEAAMRRLKEACELLALPLEHEAADGTGTVEEGEGVPRGLREVVKDVFEDNDKARAILQALGMMALSTSEARGLLQRRIDAWA